MRIAVEGCCHGELDKIYETVAYLEQTNKMKVDLLLICGDFQAVRNKSDLQTMAVPPKYRQMNTFWKYYSGVKKAPILTIMIGGNHEASNYLQELPYGGWIAHNIYYLGYAGIVNCAGVRIGGLSGIYKSHDYNRGHFEHPPYHEDTKRSCYHVRNVEIFRMKQVQQPIDIFISHDWPGSIFNHGNVKALLARKKHFREDIEKGELGNPHGMDLMKHLKPDYWFAAHLHVKFPAIYEHKSRWDRDGTEPKQTKFLSLDKCLPHRKFLQIIKVGSDDDKPVELELDQEWMSILKSTNHLLNLSRRNRYMPGPGSDERYNFTPTPHELQSIHDDFDGLFTLPKNFEKTAEDYDPEEPNKPVSAPQILINPQTTLLCEMLGLTDPFAVFSGRQQHSQTGVVESPSKSLTLDDSALLDESDFFDNTLDTTTINTTLETTVNPDEISLDEDDDSCIDEAADAATSSPIHPSHLSLPAPRFSTEKDPVVKRLIITEDSPENLNASLDSTGSSPSGKRSFSLDTVSTSTGEDSSPDKTKRKFKRRNQSLYENEEDES